METIKFSDFQIIPIHNSIKRIEMDDDTYFGPNYKDCVSNSRLSLINPSQDGSAKKYFNPPKFETSSLKTGSYVHQLLLQPDEFCMAPKMGRPTAKLGDVLDEIIKNRIDGLSIYDSIVKACNKIGYYINCIDKKISYIIEKGLKYYININTPRPKKSNKIELIISDKDHDIVTSCLQSCYDNQEIMNKLQPTGLFGDIVESHNEDAMFMEYLVTYKDKYVKLKFKLKIDNWTIDIENKTITLNDLKTTSHGAEWFMYNPTGSIYKYHYYRQFQIYKNILWEYCVKQYGACAERGWKIKCNVLVVQTTSPYTSKCYSISEPLLKKGQVEFEKLLKRVAYYQLHGYKREVDFE